MKIELLMSHFKAEKLFFITKLKKKQMFKTSYSLIVTFYT